MNNQDHLLRYIDYSSDLNADNGLEEREIIGTKESKNHGFTHYRLSLTPDDFFLFNAGVGDQDVDNIPVTESVMQYDSKGISFVEMTLVPGSSIKGAMAHRVCYHYNKLSKITIEGTEKNDYIHHLGNNNKAVLTIFGTEADQKNKKGHRGIVMIDDIYIKDADNTKIFNHVAIDRFTGGAMQSALFSEKVTSLDEGQLLEINIHLDTRREQIEDGIIQALEATLKDICTGLLPLGGMVTKGHGSFSGTLAKNNQIIYSQTNN